MQCMSLCPQSIMAYVGLRGITLYHRFTYSKLVSLQFNRVSLDKNKLTRVKCACGFVK